jgi:hypothetical protein
MRGVPCHRVAFARSSEGRHRRTPAFRVQYQWVRRRAGHCKQAGPSYVCRCTGPGRIITLSCKWRHGACTMKGSVSGGGLRMRQRAAHAVKALSMWPTALATNMGEETLTVLPSVLGSTDNMLSKHEDRSVLYREGGGGLGETQRLGGTRRPQSFKIMHSRSLLHATPSPGKPSRARPLQAPACRNRGRRWGQNTPKSEQIKLGQ